jgi:hypothetical protein
VGRFTLRIQILLPAQNVRRSQHEALQNFFWHEPLINSFAILVSAIASLMTL